MGPLETVYYIGYSIKKNHSLKNQKRLPSKVISIGNITTGGTGKTPAVIAVAEEAKKYGYNPCILTRGYGGRGKGPIFVRRRDGTLLSPDDVGDEPLLMAERLRDVPVVKGADRYETGMFALVELDPQPSLFILDDGFQHWRLYRDMDVLLVDSSNPFGNRKLLPSGTLREPLTEIKRADIIVITRTGSTRSSEGYEEGMQDLVKDIKRYNAHAPIYLSSHIPRYMRKISGDELPVDILSGKSALGFCGIGNPGSFKETLLGLGIEIREFLSFRDHYRYARKDIQRICRRAEEYGADWIITTEKDIMRLEMFDLPGNLISLGIEFSVDKGFFERVFRED